MVENSLQLQMIAGQSLDIDNKGNNISLSLSLSLSHTHTHTHTHPWSHPFIDDNGGLLYLVYTGTFERARSVLPGPTCQCKHDHAKLGAAGRG